MKEIILKMGSPKEAVEFTTLLFQNGFKPEKALINYNIWRKLPVKIKRLDDYPLILEGKLNGHEMRVAVTPLAAGSYSEGSFALRTILKTAHFVVDDRDLFSPRISNSNTGWIRMEFRLK